MSQTGRELVAIVIVGALALIPTFYAGRASAKGEVCLRCEIRPDPPAEVCTALDLAAVGIEVARRAAVAPRCRVCGATAREPCDPCAHDIDQCGKGDR